MNGESLLIARENEGAYHLKADKIRSGRITVTIPLQRGESLSNGTLRIRYRSHHSIKAVIGFDRKEDRPVGVGVIPNEAFISLADTLGQEEELRIPLPATPALA